MIKEYIAYLKDNPNGYWFKRKLYGWGWTPARWQGWVMIGIFLCLLIGNAVRFEARAQGSTEVPVGFLVETGILVLILLGICYKTGEKPRWQWGMPKDTHKEE